MNTIKIITTFLLFSGFVQSQVLKENLKYFTIQNENTLATIETTKMALQKMKPFDKSVSDFQILILSDTKDKMETIFENINLVHRLSRRLKSNPTKISFENQISNYIKYVSINNELLQFDLINNLYLSSSLERTNILKDINARILSLEIKSYDILSNVNQSILKTNSLTIKTK